MITDVRREEINNEAEENFVDHSFPSMGLILILSQVHLGLKSG